MQTGCQKSFLGLQKKRPSAAEKTCNRPSSKDSNSYGAKSRITIAIINTFDWRAVMHFASPCRRGTSGAPGRLPKRTG